jgi:hypothetical protein
MNKILFIIFVIGIILLNVISFTSCVKPHNMAQLDNGVVARVTAPQFETSDTVLLMTSNATPTRYYIVGNYVGIVPPNDTIGKLIKKYTKGVLLP